jgi:hypothetical protein
MKDFVLCLPTSFVIKVKLRTILTITIIMVVEKKLLMVNVIKKYAYILIACFGRSPIPTTR